MKYDRVATVGSTDSSHEKQKKRKIERSTPKRAHLEKLGEAQQSTTGDSETDSQLRQSTETEDELLNICQHQDLQDL